MAEAPAPAAQPDRNVRLTEFEGDKTSFSEWAQHVHMCQRIAPWSDGQTAQRVKLQLKGTAAVWLNNRISEGTEGLDEWYPEANEAGVRAPNLRSLLEERFAISHSPAEQANLRSSLQQKDSESVAAFFDRCQAVQFELDKGYTVAFRVDSKAQYEIVHQQQLLSNFMCGLRQNIRKHVTTVNANTCQTARAAAISFELGNKTATAKLAASYSTDYNTTNQLAAQVTGMVIAQMRGQSGQRGQRGGRGGGQASQQSEDEGFCTYCGYVGHSRPKCNIRKKDEAKGLFLPQSPYYAPGRVGRGSRGGRGGRGGQSTRGRVSEVGDGAVAPQQSQWQQNLPPQQQQQVQEHQPQQPFVPQPRQPPTFYNDQGGASAYCDAGAFRFFPPQTGNQ